MSKTILLADDSPTIRKVVELTFGDTGIRVETAASGIDALERFERLRPDLVLADVVMPEPAGYELCRRVKASDHPVPVLLLAGTFDPYDPQRASDCGADGRVVKPFESRALVERVESLLAAGPSRPPAASASPAATVEEPPPQPAEAAVEVLEEPAASALPAGLSPEDMEAIVEAVLARLSDRVLREVAERVVRERIRELEGEDLR